MDCTNSTDKIIKTLEIKNDIEELESFYVDGKITNLNELVESRKKSIVNEIMDYKEKNTEVKCDKYGLEVSRKVKLTPYIVSTYFFKSITNLQNLEPTYSGEHLSILWELYEELVLQVNINLCEFTPTLSHFCKFIGLTLNGFKKMKNSSDLGISTIVNKIIDSFYDNNLKMAELGMHSARATVYRMKSELERIEKETPQVTINATNISLEDINKRILELSDFNKSDIESQKHE